MKSVVKRTLSALILGLILAAAVPDAGGNYLVTAAGTAGKAALSRKTVSIRAGGKTVLALKDADSEKKISWSSSNTKIVSVKRRGKNGTEAVVRGKKAGTAKVIAVYGGKKYTCRVTVKPAPVLSEKKITIYSGSEVKLTLKNPLKKGKTVWRSSNPSAVGVEGYSNQAMITGIGTGSSVVTAVHNGKKYRCKVIVKEIAYSMAVTNCYSGSLRVGDTGQFKCVVRPANTGGVIRWFSSNTKVASIDSRGKVTAKAPGIAVITAKTSDGSRLSKSIKIVVAAG